MKKRIKRGKGIWIILLLVIVLVVFFCWIINKQFLFDYLQNKKIASMKAAYTEINNAFNKGLSDTDEFQITIENLCERNNANILVVDSTSDVIVAASRDSEMMGNVLFGYLFKFSNGKIEETIEVNKKYEIYIVKDPHNDEVYYDMWGLCDNGNIFLIRSPLSSVREAVEMAGHFLNYIVVIILSVITVGIVILSRYIFVRELKLENERLSYDIEQKEKIDEMRKEFLSNVSHELKTPIALIQGYAEGLQDSVNTDEESKNFYCEVIMDEASKMNDMVCKLLNLNHLEFGDFDLNYATFNIVELIKNYLSSVAILIEQHKVNVNIGDYEPIYVYSDEYCVREIFGNYFSNALNHVSGDNSIEITLEEKEDKVYVYVFNTGSQIPEECIEHIWEKFYKVDKARTRAYGGSGVGLSIVKAMVESMNQEYGVDNFAEGVRFYFTLQKAYNVDM